MTKEKKTGWYFKFSPGDYLRDTQCLNEKAQVAYDRIMCEHMRNICISQQQHKFFTKRLNEDELFELNNVLKMTEDGYQIEWVAKSILDARAYSASRSENREGKKKKKKEEHMLTYVPHMDSNSNSNSNSNNSIKTKKELVFQNDADEYRVIWQQWITYKKDEHKDKFKTVQSEQIALNNLYTLSDNLAPHAREIVNNSISNRYKGLFKPNKNASNSQSKRSDPLASFNRSIAEAKELYQAVADGQRSDRSLEDEIYGTPIL